MTRLWKNGRFITDEFAGLADDEQLREEEPLLISMQRWRESRKAVLAVAASVGVVAPPTTVLSSDDDVNSLALIAIPFAKFSDGRGYSLARRLRDQFKFSGELRATGEVLLDQIPLMLRCGFDGFALSHAPTIRELESGRLPLIPEVYQSAVYGRARTSANFNVRQLMDAAE